MSDGHAASWNLAGAIVVLTLWFVLIGALTVAGELNTIQCALDGSRAERCVSVVTLASRVALAAQVVTFGIATAVLIRAWVRGRLRLAHLLVPGAVAFDIGLMAWIVGLSASGSLATALLPMLR